MKYRKEYEAYMKLVTDAFIDMQSDRIKGTIGHDRDEVFYTINWESGLNYCLKLDAKRYISGMTYDDAKEHNAKTAMSYLRENSITYIEYVQKFFAEDLEEIVGYSSVKEGLTVKISTPLFFINVDNPEEILYSNPTPDKKWYLASTKITNTDYAPPKPGEILYILNSNQACLIKRSKLKRYQERR